MPSGEALIRIPLFAQEAQIIALIRDDKLAYLGFFANLRFLAFSAK